MGLTSCIISFIGLMGISDWDNFLLVKIVFDELRNTIDMFSHFSTNFVSKAKDFDKYLTWYEESGGRELDVQYYDLPKSGLNFDSVNINLDNKFLLEAHGLSIKPNDFILLRGKTGIGKTQLVNCLQGYTPGATLSNTKFQPKNYSKNWEYLNQNMRETIPTNGLSLREMLENESDTDLIMELIRVVKLDDKIILNSDINEKMQGYSGGQRMKTSLVFTLLEVIKNRKSILVLDEPEQGLDPFSRLDVIQSVLEFCKTGIKKYIGSINLSVLVIYHGDDTDIIKMNKLFNKIWLFDKKLNKSYVTQTLNIKEFCTNILKNKQQELDKLSIEIQ
jgi:ATPase subunit of ABC transporter with duplicated ATPase domains